MLFAVLTMPEQVTGIASNVTGLCAHPRLQSNCSEQMQPFIDEASWVADIS